MTEGLNTIQGNNALNTQEPGNIMGLRVVNRIDELYSPEYFGGLSQLAGAAAKSRLFGELTPDQLFIILMTGREMGLPPTVALRNIGSFKGKTVITSQLQLAKVKEAGYIVKIVENTDDRATVSVQHKGEDPYVKTFTMADAVKAGLPERNALYKTSPATMLLNRAIGLACRYGAPEVLNGLYNETELIEVDEPGHVAQEPRAASGAVNTPMADATVNGWTIEAQESFADLKDRLYTAFKDAGKLDKHPAEAEKWQKRMATDEASKVNDGLLAFVLKLETAAKPKAVNTDDKIVRAEVEVPAEFMAHDA
jgi:hypothetical protein